VGVLSHRLSQNVMLAPLKRKCETINQAMHKMTHAKLYYSC